ncbi:hypothetical protein BN381_110054 [Candidatus Microthrix parvicella RN1]|uniref:Uncharacterized protein n=2 Tax=Candidatus Neomicrothrix TaxID=41949 RepID=R4YWL0_9ACTN|nr:hypothetical protein BN381_110054 [Candidatus Microthrix parvicella RN1]
MTAKRQSPWSPAPAEPEPATTEPPEPESVPAPVEAQAPAAVRSLWSPASPSQPFADGPGPTSMVGSGGEPSGGAEPASTSWFEDHSSEPRVGINGTGDAASAWCRACGAPQMKAGSTCDGCGWALDTAEVPPSYVGLVFAMPGRLLVNKKRGVCVAADEQSLQLHFSAEDSQVVPLVGAPAFDGPWSRPDLSPSARLQHAARQAQAGDVKASWDPAVLLQAAGSWANVSVAAMRRLADEALPMGWTDVFDWVGLTPSEKSWRRAHHAASIGDTDGVRRHLADLPPTGYPDRARLCVRCLDDILKRSADWHPIVVAAKAVVPQGVPVSGVELLDVALDGGSGAALRRFGEVLVGRGHGDRGRYWLDAADRLGEGMPGLPPDQPHPAWMALSHYLNRTETFPAERVRQLSPSLLDDLIDAGSLDPVTAFDHLGEADRTYLEARLRPEALPLDQLRRSGHHDELARRAFLVGDESLLEEVPPGEAVEHYRQLFNAALGRPVTPNEVRDEAREAISAAVEARRLVGAEAQVEQPVEVVHDPSLWGLFAEGARRGSIKVTDEQRRRAPRYADWVALHELAGLVADGAMERAVEVGRPLVDTIGDPARRAEASSLTAAALRALDRSDEAYELVQASLANHYSQGLWLNAAILAEEVNTDAVPHYWNHLAKELPAPDSWAALLRAVEAPGLREPNWWSPEMVALATSFLAECDLGTYARLLSASRHGAPELVAGTPQRGDEFDHARYLFVALSAAYRSKPVRSSALVGAFTSVSQSRRGDAWFVRELQYQAEVIAQVLLDSFEGAEVASEVALAISRGDLAQHLRPEQVYLLGSLGFAQRKGLDAQTKTWISNSGYERWIFGPLSEFRSVHVPTAPPWMDLVYEGFSKAIYAAIVPRLTLVIERGTKLQGLTEEDRQLGIQTRLEVDAERRSDRGDLIPHLELGKDCLRNLRTLTPGDTTLNSIRIHEVDGLLDSLRGLVDAYGARQ